MSVATNPSTPARTGRPWTRRVETVATRARRLVASQATLLDVVAAATLAGFAVFSVRYVDITIRDQLRKIDAARRVANAALNSGGQTASDARELLQRLDVDLLRLPPVALYGLAFAATIPLVRRRSSPMIVGLIVLGSSAALSWYSPADVTVPALASCLALYSIAAYARQTLAARWALSIVAVVVLVALMSGAVHRGDIPDPNLALRDIVYGACFVSLILLSALSFGEITRRHRQALLDLERHAALLASQQDALARTAILDERVRIARELHDVVAHHVSVMGVQAGAARLRLAAGPADDERVRAALSSIEQSSRQAVDDLHHLVGFLRSEDAASSLASPQPSLEELGALVDEHRNSGLAVTSYVTGELAAVPAGIGLAAYRIVQEALTNVRKHAASCRSATLRLDVGTETLRIAVHNSPASGSTMLDSAAINSAAMNSSVINSAAINSSMTNSAAINSSMANSAAINSGAFNNGPRPSMTIGGHGIVGMRERAALHGGTVHAQHADDGGFLVRAELPMRTPGGR